MQADDRPFADQGPEQQLLGNFEFAGAIIIRKRSASALMKHQERMPELDPVSVLQSVRIGDG